MPGYGTTTGDLGLPYPFPDEDLDIAGDFQLLAQAVDDGVTQQINNNVVTAVTLTAGVSNSASITNGQLDLILATPDISSKYDKTGGTITGNVTVTGTLGVQGASTFTGEVTVPTPTAPSHAVTKSYVDQVIIPVGLIAPYAGLVAPTGWHLCDGSTHGSSALQAILVAGGKATPTTTPDLRNRFIYGSGTVTAHQTTGSSTMTLTTLHLPAHNHTINTNTEATAHSHTIIVDNGNAWHGHSAGTYNADINHQHNFNTAGAGDHAHGYARGELYSGGMATGSTLVGQIKYSHNEYTTGSAGWHGHAGTTDWMNQNNVHSHGVWLNGDNATHNHSASSNSVSTAHSHTSNNTGSGGSFSLIPPAYALTYIIYKGV